MVGRMWLAKVDPEEKGFFQPVQHPLEAPTGFFDRLDVFIIVVEDIKALPHAIFLLRIFVCDDGHGLAPAGFHTIRERDLAGAHPEHPFGMHELVGVREHSGK